MSIIAILTVTHTEHYNLVDSLPHLNAAVTPETWDLKNEKINFYSNCEWIYRKWAKNFAFIIRCCQSLNFNASTCVKRRYTAQWICYLHRQYTLLVIIRGFMKVILLFTYKHQHTYKEAQIWEAQTCLLDKCGLFKQLYLCALINVYMLIKV